MPWKNRLRQHSKTIVLLAIWLVIWSVPELRLLCRMQVRGSEYAPTTAFATTAFTPFVFRQPIAPTAGELARLYPHSIEARAKAPEQRGDGELPIAIARQRYDALLHEHPDSLWLLTTRLRIAVQELKDGRVAGGFEHQAYNSNSTDWPTVGIARAIPDNSFDGSDSPPPPSVPSRPTLLRPRSIADQVQPAIALAERGRKLEPNNCFYDWVLTYFLFAAHRDADALAALEAGARKPYYDSHLQDEMRAAVAVGELGRPLAFEERRSIAATQYEQHYNKLMHLTWLVEWAGTLAERRGDHAQALRIYSAMTNIGARMQTVRTLPWEAIEGLMLQLSAWRRWPLHGIGFYDWHGGIKDSDINRLARNFAAYAVSHGRPELATATAAQFQTATRLNDLRMGQADNYDINNWHTFGLDSTMQLKLDDFSLASGMTLVYLQLALVSWLIATLLLWKRMNWFWRLLAWVWRGIGRLWGTPKFTPLAATLPAPPLYTRLDLRRSLIFSSLIVTLAGCAMFKLYPLYFTHRDVYPNRYELPLYVTGSLYLIGPLFCGLLWIGSTMLWRYRPPRLNYSVAHQALPGFAVRESAHTLQLPSLCYLFAAFWVWSLTLYAALAWLLFYYTQYVLRGAPSTPLFWGITTADIAVRDSVLPWALTVPAIISWIVKWWWQIAPEQKFRAFQIGLVWYRDLLFRWLLIGSAAYLLWLLASLPTRHRADAQLSAFLNQTTNNLTTNEHQ